MMTHDQKLHMNMQEIASRIDQYLKSLDSSPDDGQNTSLFLIREIFTADIRTGGVINKLYDESLEVLLPRAKDCLKTLDILAEHEYLRVRDKERGFNKLDKASVKALLPQTEAGQKTLDVLAKHGYVRFYEEKNDGILQKISSVFGK